MPPRDQLLQVAFVGGAAGHWKVKRMERVAGPALTPVTRVAVRHGTGSRPPSHAAWVLRGITTEERYVTLDEQEPLRRRSPPLGRPEATRAVLIPVKKSDEWWSLAQDERRAVLEEQSHHIQLGLRTLPGVARRLYHSRELQEPFDFLTWFEFAPSVEKEFDELLATLRASPEWAYVEREIEIRLLRA